MTSNDCDPLIIEVEPRRNVNPLDSAFACGGGGVGTPDPSSQMSFSAFACGGGGGGGGGGAGGSWCSENIIEN